MLGMKRAVLISAVCAVALALVPATSRADAVVYTFAALPGPNGNCYWFNEHINDRSTDSLAHLVDLIYNRAAIVAGGPLVAGTPVTVTQTGTDAKGDTIKSFTYNGRLLCAQAGAITPPTPEPSTAPAT